MNRFLNHPFIIGFRRGQFLLASFIFFYVALLPASDTPGPIPASLLHFIGNFLLVGSAWVAFLKPDNLKANLKQILILCALLSLCSELAQSFTESRLADPMDLVFNALGLGVGLCVCWGLNKYYPRLTGHA